MGPMLPRVSISGVPERVLIIPDTHFPWQHPDFFDFIKDLKKTFRPDLIVHLGDEVDWHSLNFHGISPNLRSNSDELKEIRSLVRRLGLIFPRMLLCESNHGLLPFRRAFAAGMSKELVRPYGEILQAPDGWRWASEVALGQDKLFIRHQFGKNISLCAKRFGASLIQGHFHENQELSFFEVTYGKVHFAATVGCFIDDKSEAFAYNKYGIFRPRLGVLLIENGVPRLEPYY